MHYLADRAEAALDQGASPAETEAILQEAGVPALVAFEIVSARARKLRHTARSYGLLRLLMGLCLVSLGSSLAAVGAFVLPTRLGRRLLFAGLLLCFAGARPMFLGLYSLLSGRDKP